MRRATWALTMGMCVGMLAGGCEEHHGNPAQTDEPDEARTVDEEGEPVAVVYIGFSVHLETELPTDQVFEKYVHDVETIADTFAAYGGKLTLESKQLTQASLLRGDDRLLALAEDGHAIGVHADLGYNQSWDDFVGDLTATRELAEAYGADVLNVSGICSPMDWVEAATQAGYEVVSGSNLYCALALDDAPVDETECPDPKTCHGGYPEQTQNLIHPWRMHSGGQWTTYDPAGSVVMIPTVTGLTCNAEALLTDETLTGCSFEADDIDPYFDKLDEVLSLADPGKVNLYKGTWSMGQVLDTELLEELLVRLQPYIDSGAVQWKTVPEMYDAYLGWEAVNGK